MRSRTCVESVVGLSVIAINTVLQTGLLDGSSDEVFGEVG